MDAGWVAPVRRFPDLTVATPRLHVRPLSPDDAKPVAEIFADARTQRWLPFPPEYTPIDGLGWSGEIAAVRRERGDGDHYAAVRREDGRLVGCLWTQRTDWVARSTEVVCAVAADARGFGVAGEAVDGLAFALMCEHDLERVELRVAAGNVAARRVAEKAGFTYEGRLRNAGCVHSGRVDVEVWSLVSADLR
jgi:[ribosomal protein S5]-alanine N-acetyltransferase